MWVVRFQRDTYTGQVTRNPPPETPFIKPNIIFETTISDGGTGLLVTGLAPSRPYLFSLGKPLGSEQCCEKSTPIHGRSSSGATKDFQGFGRVCVFHKEAGKLKTGGRRLRLQRLLYSISIAVVSDPGQVRGFDKELRIACNCLSQFPEGLVAPSHPKQKVSEIPARLSIVGC